MVYILESGPSAFKPSFAVAEFLLNPEQDMSFPTVKVLAALMERWSRSHVMNVTQRKQKYKTWDTSGKAFCTTAPNVIQTCLYQSQDESKSVMFSNELLQVR